jgi:hypothetical protein
VQLKRAEFKLIEPVPFPLPDASLPSRIIQLVPRFRPDADGLGECSLNLGDALLKGYGIRSDFLVYNSPRQQSTLEMPDPFLHSLQTLGGGESGPLNSALDKLIANASEPPLLLLHYVSYGYSHNGTPVWLHRAMERFLAKGGRLVTLFHELFATGPFPSRTFFTSWLQHRVFRRLLSQSESVFISNEEYRRQIERDSAKQRPVSLIGICSNVGEPEDPKPLTARRRRIAVFGQFATRKHLYSNYLPDLLKVMDHLAVDEIADIGPVDDPEWMEANVVRPLGSRVHSVGTQSPAATSALLQDCILGALQYRYAMRWKSGVFAAYQAHAVPILLFPHHADEINPEPREPGDWCFSAEQLLALPPDSLIELQRAATRGFQHYQQFRASRRMAECLIPALMNKNPTDR